MSCFIFIYSQEYAWDECVYDIHQLILELDPNGFDIKFVVNHGLRAMLTTVNPINDILGSCTKKILFYFDQFSFTIILILTLFQSYW